MRFNLGRTASKLLAPIASIAATPAGAFLTVTLWDFLATVFTRTAASGSLLAVPANLATSALWLATLGIILNDRRPAIIMAILSGVAVGTWLGLLVG